MNFQMPTREDEENYFSDKDNIVPEFMFKQNAAAFPNAEIHCYSPAGHAPFLDKPQEFYRDMAAFLRS